MICLSLLFVVVGFSQEIAKTTGELPSDPLTFFVHGDTHCGLAEAGTINKKISKRIIEYKPKMIFHTGDVIHNLTNPAANWNSFDYYFGPTVRRNEYYPTIGNHDDINIQLYFDYFDDLPDNGDNGYYYYVEKPEAIFIVLDVHTLTAPGNLNAQLQWLQNVLATYSTKLYKFVFFHRASHTYGMRGPCTWALQFDSVFQQYDVDIVFMGHTHAYERFEFSGIQYIVTGGAGGTLHDLVPPIQYPGMPDPVQYSEETHNYVTVALAPQFAYVAARYPDGITFDSFYIYK